MAELKYDIEPIKRNQLSNLPDTPELETHHRIIGILAEEGPLTLSQLKAKLRDINPTELSQAVNQLELFRWIGKTRKGFI